MTSEKLNGFPIRVSIDPQTAERVRLRIEGDFVLSRFGSTLEEVKLFGDEFLTWCNEGEMTAIGPIEIEVTPLL